MFGKYFGSEVQQKINREVDERNKLVNAQHGNLLDRRGWIEKDGCRTLQESIMEITMQIIEEKYLAMSKTK